MAATANGSGGDVGLVVGGGGARGAYASGVLSVLLPELKDRIRIGWSSDGGLVPAGTARMSNRTPHGGWWHGCCVWRLVVLRWRESDLG